MWFAGVGRLAFTPITLPVMETQHVADSSVSVRIPSQLPFSTNNMLDSQREKPSPVSYAEVLQGDRISGQLRTGGNSYKKSPGTYRTDPVRSSVNVSIRRIAAAISPGEAAVSQARIPGWSSTSSPSVIVAADPSPAIENSESDGVPVAVSWTVIVTVAVSDASSVSSSFAMRPSLAGTTSRASSATV